MGINSYHNSEINKCKNANPVGLKKHLHHHLDSILKYCFRLLAIIQFMSFYLLKNYIS